MRVKALLFTVNLAAALTLLVASGALAQGGSGNSTSGTNSTADFLKQVVEEKKLAQSLKPALPSSPKRHKAETFALKAVPTARLAYDGGRPVKLRAFVPNRKLPSRAQLEAQVPQFDTSSQSAAANLSGNVNQANYLPAASSAYQAPGYAAYSSQSPAAGAMRGKLQNVVRAAAGQLERRSSGKMIAGLTSGLGARMNSVRSTPVAGAQPNCEQTEPSQEALTADQELEAMARELATDKAGMANLEQEAQSASVGASTPAPFPLNLIPEASLKQFIGGKSAAATASAVGGSAPSVSSRPNVSPSYFGSWKLSQNAVAGKPHLAAAGFRSNLPARSQPRGARRLQAAACRTYAPVAVPRLSAKAVSTSSSIKAVKHVPPSVSKAESVATYPPYTSPSL